MKDLCLFGWAGLASTETLLPVNKASMDGELKYLFPKAFPTSPYQHRGVDPSHFAERGNYDVQASAL